MTPNEQKQAAIVFAEKWRGIGDEKQHTQTFWIELLQKVYGVENPFGFITFEDRVKLSHTSFIDASIPETHTMIEQKSLGKDLSKPIKQSDGSLLTPYQQAKRYAAELPYSKRPRWIVACNFAEFRVYDMENPQAEPEIILLKDFGKEYHRLNFLVNARDRNIKKEMELSLAAGVIVGKLYDALLKEYKDPESDETQKNLNKLCVRLVFCLYAEDAGIFGSRNQFCDYLKHFQPEDARMGLIELFETLSTPIEDRDPYMDGELAAFPYVNGGLFQDSRVDLQRQIPQFTDEILNLLLKNASLDFDWSGIFPTIFGAVFESTLNPETRRKGGMHYTSIENIHKVIDPLFLNDLKREFEAIKSQKNAKTRRQSLADFQTKLASLTFLDPCCGSAGMFIQSTNLVRAKTGDISRINVYGQEKEAATWRLAKMNLALRGISHNLSTTSDSSFTNDLHRGLYFDYIMANPPFNLKGWWDPNLSRDARWTDYAIPPASNANYAWILHILHHLKPLTGVAGFLLSNGALADSDAKEIRRKLIENDKIEAIIILPRELFITTDISVTLWILNQNKRGGDYHGRILRNRAGEILFMDLRSWRENTVKNEGKKKVMLDSGQIEKAAHIYHTWQEIGAVGIEYAKPELYRSVGCSEIAENDYSLVPSNYIEFIDHDLDIDYPTEMAKVQERMKALIRKEKKSQEKLMSAFKGIGYEIV